MKFNLDYKHIGKFGEQKATDYLKKQNYTIIDRNFICKQGELDIIAQDDKEIVFCEVKTRNNFNFGKPVDAVNKEKKKHILKAAKYYLYKNNLENNFIRFDVIEVYIRKNGIFINQIKNIFI